MLRYHPAMIYRRHSKKRFNMVQLSLSLKKAQTIHFVWQHLWLLVSLYIMTLGVALSIRSNVGSSVISSLPMSLSLAGSEGMVPALSIGDYTNIMNAIFVFLQILILRRRFEPIQLFQLLIGSVFGALIDLNMSLTSVFDYSTLPAQLLAAFLGSSVLGIGVALEVRCGSVTMPGEGIQVAISRVTGAPFPKVKIIVDTCLVIAAVASCYIFWGTWQWNIIGPGTLFAMVYVGWLVRIVSGRLGWFDRVLGYQPGFRRYVFGLARYIFH